MLKEVADKIIELLKADPDLNFNWYFLPPIRASSTPYGYVDFIGGPAERIASTKSLFTFDYHIVIVDRKRSDTDDVDRLVLDRTEKAMEILRNNNTLDGLVVDSRILAVEGDFAETQKGHLFGTRITLQVKLWL